REVSVGYLAVARQARSGCLRRRHVVQPSALVAVRHDHRLKRSSHGRLVVVPWFEATVRIRGSSVSGFLIDPKGTVSGIAVHEYLWVVFAVALVQFVVLAGRYVPDRRGFTLPRYRQFLVVTPALSCIAVLVAFAVKPTAWPGPNQLGDGFYIVVNWSCGAVAALG